MKELPNDWERLDDDRKAKHMLGIQILPCYCNRTFGEVCPICCNLSDVEEKDRDYYKEMLILLRYMAHQSHKDGYWDYHSLVEIDNPESFNLMVRERFIEGLVCGDNSFNVAWGSYNKSIRQADYYSHITIKRDKPVGDDGDHISSGILDSMLHTLLNNSQIPSNVMKILIKL